jgi:hypothetical protein
MNELKEQRFMKRIAFLPFAAITVACFVVTFSPASGNAAGEAAPIYVTQIPPGYRDWKVIAVAPRRRQPQQSWCDSGQRYRDQSLPRREASVSGWQLSPLCTIVMSRRRKTTKFSGARNRSFQGHPRTYSLWSRTQQSTRQRAAGDSVTSTQATGNLAMRRS